MGTFSLQIAEWVAKTKGNADEIVRRTLSQLDGELIFRSPVGDTKYWLSLRPYTDLKSGKQKTMLKGPAGYAGGRFKGAWMLSTDAPDRSIPNRIDPTGAATNADHKAFIAATGAGHVHYMQNNMPYAKRLEDGWSRQAPVGLVGLTVVNFQNYVDAAVRAVK
jgi:hypothetical protein